MSKSIKFYQVDVFTKKRFKGNPVAVIMDGNNLTIDQMQTIANWTNLSETTFVCKATNPKADYRLRIFSPITEKRFAGHPTLGTAWALLQNNFKPRNPKMIVQECDAGLINIHIEKDNLFLEVPKPQIERVSNDLNYQIANCLHIDISDILISEIIDTGNIWNTIEIKDTNTLLNLHPNFEMLSKILSDKVAGLTVFSKHDDNKINVRSFAPNDGVNEDPVCGSSNSGIAYMIKNHKILAQNEYVANQGRCLNRDGKIKVRLDVNGAVWVGGNAVTCIVGNILND